MRAVPTVDGVRVEAADRVDVWKAQCVGRVASIGKTANTHHRCRACCVAGPGDAGSTRVVRQIGLQPAPAVPSAPLSPTWRTRARNARSNCGRAGRALRARCSASISATWCSTRCRTRAYFAVNRHAAKRLRQWLCRKHRTKRGKYVRFPEQRLYVDYGLLLLTRPTMGLPSAKA